MQMIPASCDVFTSMGSHVDFYKLYHGASKSKKKKKIVCLDTEMDKSLHKV